VESTIRSLLAGDLAAIRALDAACFASEDAYADEDYAAMESSPSLVAADGDRLVGYAFVTDEGRIRSLAVRPDMRRRGIGAALLRHAIAGARGPLDLLVDESNDAALRLYRRAGFAVAEPDPAVPLRTRLVYDGRGLARKPFRHAVRAGETLYLSGKIGLDPATGRPPPEAAGEARLLMDGLRDTLAEFGMTTDALAMVTIFTPDVGLFSAFNEVYLSYFDGPLPARAFVGSGPLLYGARFELTAIAASSLR
jgi:2-iminobutanoate/2-iminopropanoate deaminase